MIAHFASRKAARAFIRRVAKKGVSPALSLALDNRIKEENRAKDLDE